MKTAKNKIQYKSFGGKLPIEADNMLEQINKIEIATLNAKSSGIIEEDDVVLREAMNNKLSTLKKKFVETMHVSQDGSPRKISKIVSEGKHYYVTYCAGRKKIKSTTLNGLYEKLYVIYTAGMGSSFSFGNMFKLGLEQKKRSKGLTEENRRENVSKENTIYRNEHDYARFISDDFANLDIREITPLILKEYTFTMMGRINSELGHRMPKKTFMNYKGILNIAFGYADEHDICKNFIMNPNKFKNSDYADLFDSSKKKPEQKAFSKTEIDLMDAEIDKRLENKKDYGTCYTDGYMFKLSKLTGMRCAELCALEKDDILFDENCIHVHSQQLKLNGSQEYVHALYTKDENGNSKGGRYVPLLPEAKAMLTELFEKQKQLGIHSKWVFANPDGSWIKSDTHYQKFLQRLSRKFNFQISNNHAIRIYYNSYVLIPAGIQVADRAKILGHSVEVNLKYYTFEDRDYCSKTYERLISSGL